MEIYREDINLRWLQHPVPLLNFARTSQGEERGVSYRIVAKTYDGRDITQLLRDNDIPLSSLFLSGYEEEPYFVKAPHLKEKLQHLGLLDQKGFPSWYTQIIFHWEETFPSQKALSVGHTYKPMAGFFY